MTKRSSVPRIESCTKALYKFFRKHPNNLFRTIYIRKAMSTYNFDDSIISQCTGILYRSNKINCEIIRGAKFYWLRHKVKGD